MSKPIRIGLMCCVSLVVACGSEATDEDVLNIRASEHAMSDAGATPPASDGGQAQAPAAPDVCATLTYANTGAPFFAAYCASCHYLPQPTFDNLDEVRNFKSRIQARLFQSPTSPMPPPHAAKQPPADEKRVLRQWLECDPLD